MKAGKGLNARQKKFALLRTAGNSQIDSYRKAGYTGGKSSASELEAKPEVCELIRTLQARGEDKLFDLQKECRQFDRAAIEGLAEIMLSSESDYAKLNAIQQLLDRGHGRTLEKVELKELPQIQFVPVDTYREEVIKRLAGMNREEVIADIKEMGQRLPDQEELQAAVQVITTANLVKRG